MSNTNSPFGLIPYMYLNGTPWNGKTSTYYIPVGNATALYKGDKVKLASSGSSDGKYPDIVKADAGDLSIGVVVGFGYDPDLMIDIATPARNYCPTLTAMYAFVVDDPNVIFLAQEDSDGAALAITAIGENVDLVYAAGSTTTGQSGSMLDSSTHNTTTSELRLLRLADVPGNAIGNYAKWLVKFNEHSFLSTTGT